MQTTVKKKEAFAPFIFCHVEVTFEKNRQKNFVTST